MGNCHTSEAATILIQRPDKRIERLYFSVSAQEVMNSNPGHYVALVVTTTPPPPPESRSSDNGGAVKQLKLLRPIDSLQFGHVYRLISFEDVLKEFNANKCGKLGKLLKEKEGCEKRPKQESGADHIPLQEAEDDGSYMSIGSSIRMKRQQWRPALPSIPELGT